MSKLSAIFDILSLKVAKIEENWAKFRDDPKKFT